MTIAMIGQKGLPARSGGIERHVSYLADGLASRGHRVIVYGRKWYSRMDATPKGIEQRLTPGIHTKHLDAITHSFTALLDARNVHPDIVHLHGSGIALLTPIARVLHPHAKIVVTFHSDDRVLSKWNWFAKWMFALGERFGFMFSHRMITVSQRLTNYCLDRYHYQSVYIPHPFPLPTAAPSVDLLVRHELTAGNYLLFVGRLIADKQAHALIEAYELARTTQPELFRDLPLVIVGSGAWTDAYVKWLYQMGARVSGVKFLGERTGDELASLQAHATAHVFPTLSEGLSFAVLEAGAYKRPVVITNLPQNREATNGYAIEVNLADVKDLSRGLIQVASASEADRAKLGEGMYAHIKKTFDANDRMDDIDHLYEELIAGTGCLTSQTLATANK